MPPCVAVLNVKNFAARVVVSGGAIAAAGVASADVWVQEVAGEFNAKFRGNHVRKG